MDLVNKALEFYDNNRIKYDKLINKIKFIKIINNNSSDLEHLELVLFDNNKNEILTTRYEILGIYYSISKLWIWSWAVADLEKKTTNISKKLLNYAFDMVIKRNDEEQIFLKTELVTSRFMIHDLIQLDVHIALSSYLSKMPLILPVVFLLGEKDTMKKFYSLDEIHLFENYKIYFLFILDYDNVV